MKKVSLNDIGDEINAKKRNGSINPTNVLCITCFINRWGIMRYGWLSLDISPCEVVCNGYFGDIGKLQCPL